MGNRNCPLGLTISACAVAMAASLGSPAAANAAESHVVQSVEKYCNASWRNAGIAQQDWADCTQETFVRVLERLSRQRLTEALADAKSEERRELNRCIWCIAQRWRRTPRYYPLYADETAERQDRPADHATLLAEVRQAVQQPEVGLTPRQRTILSLWLDGHRVAEIADRLAIPPARVSDEKHKALSKLRRTLA